MALDWRPFGATYHTACIMHECDRCMHPILPGDLYERYVERRKGKIVVWKYHRDPSCRPSLFDWNEGEESDDGTPANDNNKEHSNERAA